MTNAIEVRRATVADADLIGRTLADAFVDDPVFAWLIPPGRSHRDDRLRLFFTSVARSYLRRDKDGYVVGDGRAAALWSAPGSFALPPGEVVREARDAVRAFGRGLGRALRVQTQMESLHPKEPEHWYLGYLGTRGIDQGRGLGGEILRTVLQRADSDGVAAYLESSCERNLTLYRRHGFEVVEEFSALGNGPSIWRMWREAQK
jgi:ribosomal protein S18 acetylase RimI-like enzyme